MATIPTPEDGARHILAVFLRSGSARPGDVLPPARVVQAFWEPLWRQADLQPALAFATDQGWIELTSNGGYRLTDAGFAAA
jgi:hypothetical protein